MVLESSEKHSHFYARVFSDTNLYMVSIASLQEFKYGAEVIINTEFGTDLAVITSFKSTEKPKDSKVFLSGFLIRYATDEDKKIQKRLQMKALDMKKKVYHLIEMLQLEMNLSHILIPLSNKTICIYYTSDSRVDFRSLLIQLRKIFPFKITLKHIGQKSRETSFYSDPRPL